MVGQYGDISFVFNKPSLVARLYVINIYLQHPSLVFFRQYCRSWHNSPFFRSLCHQQCYYLILRFHSVTSYIMT